MGGRFLGLRRRRRCCDVRKRGYMVLKAVNVQFFCRLCSVTHSRGRDGQRRDSKDGGKHIRAVICRSAKANVMLVIKDTELLKQKM